MQWHLLFLAQRVAKQFQQKDKTMTILSIPVGKYDHIQGREDAPVTLLEYGDFECPYCGQAFPIVKHIQQELGNDLQFVFRHFPLSEVHPHASQVAHAAEAAGKQGKFWEMHDMLFEHQDALEDEDLVGYADELELDTKVFIDDFESPAVAKKVQEDFMSGVRSGVNGTPTFFINGVRFDEGYDYDTLLSALEEEIKANTV